MKSLVKRLLNIRFIRYGLVGGIGIPVMDTALLFFKHLLGNIIPSTQNVFLYPLALICAFEVSTTINFVLNQLFTYSEQKLSGWQWVRRAVKAQSTSLSALLLSYTVTLILVYVFHVNEYIAPPAGIIIAFIYNYFLSKKLVFRPTTIVATLPAAEEMEPTSTT